MNYFKILRTSYRLTTTNLTFWLFGLVLYGGFNLYLIHLFALLSTTGKFDLWRIGSIFFSSTFNTNFQGYALVLFALMTIFIVLNLIKIFFIIMAHNEMHNIADQTCDACVKIKSQNLPYITWLKFVLLTSIVTVLITSTITLAAGLIVSQYVIDISSALVVNVIFVGLVTCGVGVWNLFTTFFVVLHGMNFAKASKAALDLMVIQMRKVAEFVFILSALYGLAVIVGNAFIHLWQHGFGRTELYQFRIIPLLLFILWFAVNNAFFNLSILLFFDNLVRSVGIRKGVTNGQLHPNILH